MIEGLIASAKAAGVEVVKGEGIRAEYPYGKDGMHPYDIQDIRGILEIQGDGVFDETRINEGVQVKELGFETDIKDRVNEQGVQDIRDKYPNVENVLDSIEKNMEAAQTELELAAEESRVEKYKGTVFENMCKEELSDHFEGIEGKQKIVDTEDGQTKPDIVLNNAKEDFQIGDTIVKQGEDLYCEVKCGKKEYLESEMAHIEKQVKGHQEGQSVVIVTKDYLDISQEKRIGFEQRLEEKGSSICVVDVYADEVEAAIYNNLLSE